MIIPIEDVEVNITYLTARYFEIYIESCPLNTAKFGQVFRNLGSVWAKKMDSFY